MTRWEYLFVRCNRNRNRWRPFLINAEPVENWTAGPDIAEYSNQLGEQGWEMVTVSVIGGTDGAASEFRVFFKRPRLD